MATITAAAGGGNYNATGSWVGSVVPGAGDDVLLTATSGNITITAAAACRSLDCLGYTGTLTHNTGFTLSIGDGTAGTGSRALRLVSGMTYTLGSATTSQISFVSTSATVQSITWATKTPGNLTFNAASGGSWQFADGLTATSITLTLTAGTLDTNGQAVTVLQVAGSGATARTLTMGSSAITVSQGGTAWSFATTTNLTISTNSATVTLTGATCTFASGATNWNGLSVVLSGSGSPAFNANGATVANLTRTGTAVKTDTFSFNGNFTVTGTLTLSANASSLVNAILVQSNTVGTARTITCNGSVVINGRADFMDITGAGSASWNLSGSTTGDCQGNSGITFTTATTRYGVVAGNFSATATWSTSSGGAGGASVPLPQDTVILDASSAAGTYTADMPRLCKDLTCTGFTRTLSFSAANSIYGSITLASGMTVSGTAGTTLAGRGSHTLTSAGKSYGQSISQIGPGGTYTVQDAFTGVATKTLTFSNGSFDGNGFNVTFGSIVGSATTTRSVTLGAGTWTILDTSGTPWSFTTTTNLTFSGASATIVLSAASTSTRTFAGGGLTYGTLTYTVAGSTGQLTVTGANTFSTINFSDASNARTLVLPSSTTTTVTTFNVNGTASKLMSVNASTAGTAATLSKSSGTVSCDYLSLKDSTATGGAAFYAGGNSTDVSGNTGWTFGTPPVTTTPSVITATTTIPTPTVAGGATSTPPVISAVTTVPAPSVSSASTAAPTAVTAITIVPAPTVSGGAAAVPGVLAASTAVPAPTVSGGATTAGAVVAPVVAIPTPTVTAATDAEATPEVIAAVVTIPTPSIPISATPTPGTVLVRVTIPGPTEHVPFWWKTPVAFTKTPIAYTKRT